MIDSEKLEWNYASLGWRVVAFLIDRVVLTGLYVMLFMLGWVMVSLGDMFLIKVPQALMVWNEAMDFAFLIVTIFIDWLYFAVQESSSARASLGKRACDMIVIDRDGGRVSFLQASLRYFSKFLSSMIFFIGYLMVAFTKRKQALHDKLADTVVLRGVPKPKGK